MLSSIFPAILKIGPWGVIPGTKDVSIFAKWAQLEVYIAIGCYRIFKFKTWYLASGKLKETWWISIVNKADKIQSDVITTDERAAILAWLLKSHKTSWNKQKQCFIFFKTHTLRSKTVPLYCIKSKLLLLFLNSSFKVMHFLVSDISSTTVL